MSISTGRTVSVTRLMPEMGYAKPGNIVFGTDSHTTTYGCVGCFSSGIGYTEMAAVLGISRAGAYELVRGKGFPALKIGSRIVVPKEKFIGWIDRQTLGD